MNLLKDRGSGLPSVGYPFGVQFRGGAIVMVREQSAYTPTTLSLYLCLALLGGWALAVAGVLYQALGSGLYALISWVTVWPGLILTVAYYKATHETDRPFWRLVGDVIILPLLTWLCAGALMGAFFCAFGTDALAKTGLTLMVATLSCAAILWLNGRICVESEQSLV